MDIEKLAIEHYKNGHIFVLTTICGHYDHKLKRRVTPDKCTPHTRVVGLSHDIDELRKSLAVDDFDISEGGTNSWAVIEVSNLGLAVPSIMFYPDPLEEWYVYDDEHECYVQMEKPTWSYGTVCYGIG